MVYQTELDKYHCTCNVSNKQKNKNNRERMLIASFPIWYVQCWCTPNKQGDEWKKITAWNCGLHAKFFLSTGGEKNGKENREN